MEQLSFNEIFSNRLRHYLTINNMTQLELSKKLGVGTTSVSNWINGIKTPRMDKVDMMCALFGCDRSDLTTIPSPAEEKRKRAIQVPVLGRVAAGIPTEAIENIVDYEEIPDTWQGEYAALKVKGDSMLPRIQEGDVLIVKRQSDAESGDIVVAMVNGEDATVKKLIKKPDGIVLQPLNPLYEPLFFSLEQRNSIPVEIWGKVVENRQKF